MSQVKTGRTSPGIGTVPAAAPVVFRIPTPVGRMRTGRDGPARPCDGAAPTRRTDGLDRAGRPAAGLSAPLAPAFVRACLMAAAFGLGLSALAGPAAAQKMPPQPGPFQACMGEKLTGRSLDDYSVRDAARACRDVTDEAGRAGLRQAGIDPATLEACAEKPLTDEEILKLRGASGPYFMMLTTFVWEVENIFPKRVLRSIEVRHYTPTMNEVGFSTRALVGPGVKGTFVLFDLGEMIPQLKHTLKIARMTYCDLP